MALIDSSYVFSTPKSILLYDLLKPSMRPHTLQKVLLPFSDGKAKENGQKDLKFLDIVKEKCKPIKYIEVSTQMNTQQTNEVVLYNIVQWQSKLECKK